MSLLSPLYSLGALAIALPLLFHLIRRRTHRRRLISTVMFLPPVRPRPKRRSRLDNLPLLLLRALALTLLAIAFARPLFRAADRDAAPSVARRYVVLVDTSASMRRADLWPQALARFDDLVAELRPGDRIAVIAFDAKPTILLDFGGSAQLGIDALGSLGDSLLGDQQPSWLSTDLGAALRLAADLASEVEIENPTGRPDDTVGASSDQTASTQVVLISDMQQGADLESLQGFDWPSQLAVDIRPVVPQQRSNAWVTLPRSGWLTGALADHDSVTDEGGETSSAAHRSVRIRVSHSPDSTQAEFRLRWGPVGDGPEIPPIQLPPGQSRVVHLAAPPAGAYLLTLSGDDHDFDNVRYFAIDPPVEQTMLLLGPDADAPRESLGYYLQRLTLDTPQRRIRFRHHGPGDGPATAAGAPLDAPDPDHIPLVVATGRLAPGLIQTLDDYVRRGGRLLYVPTAADDQGELQQTLRLLVGDDAVSIGEAVLRDDALLARVDFTHPLFAPLAAPRFNDFSKIRFWRHRLIAPVPADWSVPAAFDNGAPALLEQLRGQGRIWILAFGWQPTESQFALSTKFIPLVSGFLDAGRASSDSGLSAVVGQRFPNLGDEAGGPSQIVRLADSPDQPERRIDSERIDQPGLYRITRGQKAWRLAANLAESESRIEPLGDDQLERYGVVIGRGEPSEAAEQRKRQLHDLELESRQGLWRWLLVAVLLMLGIETLWGARASRFEPSAAASG